MSGSTRVLTWVETLVIRARHHAEVALRVGGRAAIEHMFESSRLTACAAMGQRGVGDGLRTVDLWAAPAHRTCAGATQAFS